MDSLTEESFDRLTRLASDFLNVPVALISLVDERRQFFKSCVGLSEPLATIRETPLTHSFCKHVVTSHRPLIIEDAKLHTLVCDNPAVSEFGVRAYAGMPLVTDEGRVLGSFCVLDTKPRKWTKNELDTLKDLAGAVTSEINLRQARNEAQRANAVKDRFLAVLSHELRTPLTPALITAINLQDDVNLPAMVREEAGIIRRNIEVEVRLIDDLLDFTRIASGKVEFRSTAVNIHELISECTFANRDKSIGKNGVGFNLELSAVNTFVHGDPARLQQVLTNLVSNAFKFTLSGKVTVATSNAAAGWMAIEVRDTGRGIAAEVMPHIFDAFEQGGRDITREHAGLGLGLAIAKGFVEAHGGKIEAASSESGTTMKVLLPTIPAPEQMAQEHVQSPAAVRQLAILLVEDHEDSLRALSRILGKHHVVSTATSVREALAVAERSRFDLLISDLGLPDGSGADIMRYFNAHRPIQGIALTGFGTASDVSETKGAGFAIHLTKPVQIADLMEAVNTVAANLRVEQQNR